MELETHECDDSKSRFHPSLEIDITFILDMVTLLALPALRAVGEAAFHKATGLASLRSQ